MSQPNLIRQRNLALLAGRGFRVASTLPTIRSGEPPRLRPLEEIGSRLLGLGALFLWVAAPEDHTASPEISSLVSRSNLASQWTEDESEIFRLSRSEANRDHANTIGWRLENMWSLAWVLGFEPPPSLDGQIDDATTRAMLFDFLKLPSDGLETLLGRSRPQPLDAVGEMEDLFYCAHNAVRSAQLGHQTVPEGFHPLRDGGAIHERRHSLTWVLSSGVAWDDTDLST